MTTIPSITIYSGTVPDRTVQTSLVFAGAVGTYLDYFDEDFTPDTNDVVTAMNTMGGEMNDIAAATEGFANYQGDYVAGTTYATGESVTYSGTQYVSKVDSNTGNTPDSSPTEWQEIESIALKQPIIASSYNQAADITVTGTTHDFDFADGDMQELTVGNDITLSFSGFVSGKVCTMILDFVNAGAHTFTYPSGIIFAGGSEPSYTTAGTDRVTIIKDKDNVYSMFVTGLDIKVVT